MADTTTDYALPYPEATDPVEVWTDMQNLAEAVDGALGDIHDVLDPSGKGVIWRYRRSTNPATLTSGTEAGVLRIDAVPLLSGHLYSIRVPRLRFSSTVTTDHVKYHIRLNTGGTATTSSAIQGRAEADHVQTVSFEVFRVPSVNESASFLLSWLRTSGTGTVTLQGVDENGIDIIVEDLGVDPGASGTNI